MARDAVVDAAEGSAEGSAEGAASTAAGAPADAAPVPAHPASMLAAVAQARSAGRHQQAAGLARDALAGLDAAREPVLAGRLHAALALDLSRLGAIEESLHHAHQALQLWRPLADAGLAADRADLHCTLSLSYDRAGLQALAVRHGVRALALARDAGKLGAECLAMNRLGTALHVQGDAQPGITMLEQAAEMARGPELAAVRHSILNNLARRWVVEADRRAAVQGDVAQALAEARRRVDEAMRTAPADAHPFQQATLLANLAGIHRRQGEAAPARACFAQAMDLAQAGGWRGLVGTLELAMACLDLETAPDTSHRAALEAAIERALADPAGIDADLLDQARHTLVQGCRALGEPALALAHLERLHQAMLQRSTSRSELQSRLLFHRAELAQARHDAERARLDAELQRLRAEAGQSEARQLAAHRDTLEREVAARTAELQQAKTAAEAASHAKSSFLSMVSHELRTPLNGLLGLVEVARRRAGGDGALAEQLGRALEAGRQLARLVEQLLEFIAADSPGPPLRQPTDLRALLQAVRDRFAPQARERGLDLQLAIDPQLPALLVVDARRLRTVLETLVGNAVKFSAPGPVQLRLAWQAAPGAPGRLRAEVADSGPGLPPQVQQRLFQPFELGDPSLARRHGGLGLGLALVQRLAQAMDGEAGVLSAPGQGSCFWLQVPADAG